MKIQISDSLSMPVNAATQKMAFIGRTGSGKSYGAGKMVEGMLEAGIQTVIIDPVGIWYGLRLLADGKSPGFPIPVFGGLKGDIPLESTGGTLVADLVVDRGISIILDVSQFESDSDKARFANDFATRFYFRKKAAPSAVHLVIEECQEFIPQNPQKGEERMLHAFQRMWKLGRNFGIGGTLISQRPQEVSKKALNQTEALFAFQMTGPQERKAIELWMSEKGIDLGIAGDLPSLKVGHCHVWSPQWLQFSEKIHIGTKTTFNSSSTPGSVGATRKQDLAPIDLTELSAKMKDTIERAKADDPRMLKAEITKLKAELARKPVAAPPECIEVPVLNEKETYLIRHGIAEIGLFRSEVSKLADHSEKIWGSFNGLAGHVANVSHPEIKRRIKVPEKYHPEIQANEPKFRHHNTGASGHETLRQDSVGCDEICIAIPKGELACLKACAQYPDGATREQLTVLTGYKRSSRDAYLHRLREKKLVEPFGDFIAATEMGRANLGSSWQPLPTGDALREHWMTKLPEGERRVLMVLVEAYPNAVERVQIDNKTGYKRSSRDAYLQRLFAKRLVDFSDGYVAASNELFG